MTQRDITDHDDAHGGLTPATAPNDPSEPPEDGYAEQITAEFTSRRHGSGVADRWIPSRRRTES
jgi:hypothetical protein